MFAGFGEEVYQGVDGELDGFFIDGVGHAWGGYAQDFGGFDLFELVVLDPLGQLGHQGFFDDAFFGLVAFGQQRWLANFTVFGDQGGVGGQGFFGAHVVEDRHGGAQLQLQLAS